MKEYKIITGYPKEVENEINKYAAEGYVVENFRNIHDGTYNIVVLMSRDKETQPIAEFDFRPNTNKFDYYEQHLNQQETKKEENPFHGLIDEIGICND